MPELFAKNSAVNKSRHEKFWGNRYPKRLPPTTSINGKNAL